MPSPSSALSTLRPDLAASFQQFDLAMENQGFVATQVLPPIDVQVQAGNFGKLRLADLLASRDTTRAPGSGYTRANYQFDKDTFATSEHGAEEPVDDREAAMYGNYLNAEQLAAARARDVVMRNYEIRVSALLFDTGTFTPTAVVTPWSTVASATPITDIEARVQAIWDATGLRPNAMVLNWKVFRNLRNCAQVIDRLKYAGMYDPAAKSISTQVLAQVFDLENIIVAGAKKNTAGEGQTASLGNVWSTANVGIGVIAKSNDFKEPCVGRTIHYSADGSQIGGVVETYRDEPARSDIVRCRMDTQEKMLYTSCWQLLSNIT